MTPPPPTPDPTPKADSGAATMCETCPFRFPDLERETLLRMAAKNPHERWPCHEDDPDGTCLGRECVGHKLFAAATPPQSDPALAAAEDDVFAGTGIVLPDDPLWHNPDRLPSPGEPPWRFTLVGENISREDETWHSDGWKGGVYPWSWSEGLRATYRTRRPLPLAPAPAPEGRGETPRTDRAAKNLDTREEVLDFARSLEIENNELRELKSTWEIGAKRHNEVKAQRAAAVAQAQAASELTARWRNLVKAYVSERSAHGRDDHSCALCAALASSPPALAASEAGK